MIMNAYMTRFGEFLCSCLSLPGFTEHALYLLELDNTTCQMQIFDTEIFLPFDLFAQVTLNDNQ